MERKIRFTDYLRSGLILVMLLGITGQAGAFFPLSPGGEKYRPVEFKVTSDSIQTLLKNLRRTAPEMVRLIPETGRYYLYVQDRSALTDELVEKLQTAFYHDISALCKLYGFKYLADWRVLVGKAARESFWGTSYLCNRTFNYFGIWKKNKPWACESFKFCDEVRRTDLVPADFLVFPDFESCLWMFIHTMYSDHFRERLPDWGMRVVDAIEYERATGMHYWEAPPGNHALTVQLPGTAYTVEELIYTWSEHDKFNMCLNCNRSTDRAWVSKVELAASRIGD